MRRRIKTLGFGLWAALWIGSVQAQEPAGGSAPVSVGQLQAAASAAYLAGDARSALILLDELRARAPKNPLSPYLAAKIFLDSGQPAAARSAAASAYRYGQSARQKYEASVLAARANLASGRYTRAALWTRASAFHAPVPEARARAQSDLAQIAALNPLEMSFDFGVTPSNNVNGGAQTSYNVIEGYTAVGQLSEDAQALAGMELRGKLRLGYRLVDTARARLSLRFEQESRRVRLAGEPMRSVLDPLTGLTSLSPIADHEFAQDLRQIALDQQVALAGEGAGVLQGQIARVTMDEAGQALWRGGKISGCWCQRGAGSTGSGQDGDGATLSLGGSFEARSYTFDRQDHLRQIWLSARAPLGWGAIESALALGAVSSTQPNSRQRSVTLVFGVTPQASILGGQTQMQLQLGHARFADYSLLGMAPQDGRADRSFGLLARYRPTGLRLGTLAPEITLEKQRRSSNVSRFSTQTVSLGMGLRARF